MPDLELRCVNCQQPYLYTEREQEINYRRNQQSPLRCPACRPSRSKLARGDVSSRYEIICDRCGKSDTVPFVPKPGRSVLCGECHSANRTRLRFA